MDTVEIVAKTDDDENSRDKIIGKNLVALRGDRTQQWIADQMRPRGFEWSQATLWAIEHGKRPLRLTEAEALADVLGIELSDLLRLPDIVALAELINAYVGAETELDRAALRMEESLGAIARLADRLLASGYPREDLDAILVGMSPTDIRMWTAAESLRLRHGEAPRQGSPSGPYTERYFAATRKSESSS